MLDYVLFNKPCQSIWVLVFEESENFSTAVEPNPPRTIHAMVSYIKESIVLSKNRLAKKAMVQKTKASSVITRLEDKESSS
jgi:hypothetical protein